MTSLRCDIWLEDCEMTSRRCEIWREECEMTSPEDGAGHGVDDTDTLLQDISEEPSLLPAHAPAATAGAAGLQAPPTSRSCEATTPQNKPVAELTRRALLGPEDEELSIAAETFGGSGGEGHARGDRVDDMACGARMSYCEAFLDVAVVAGTACTTLLLGDAALAPSGAADPAYDGTKVGAADVDLPT